nr:hypothetical protein [Delftia acidovorans]
MAGSHHLARHPRRNPTVHWLDIAEAAGDPREIAEAVLIAALQLFLIAGVMRPLESRFPAERWSDRRLTTVDRNYTLRMLLGHDVRPSPVHQRTHAPRGRERLLGGCRQRARLGGCIR